MRPATAPNASGTRPEFDRGVRLGAVAALALAACGRELPAPSAAVASAAASGAEQSAASGVAAGPKVVFLGDSITAGLHLSADLAYPAVLQRRLAAAGTPFELVNAGVSGDTSAGGLSRLDWLLKQDPAWVVLALGGNDGLRGLPLETIEENLRAIVERARGAGAGVLLLGMRMPVNYGEDYTQGFAELYERIAADSGVPFVPFYIEGVGGVPELNLSDGLHPTAEGHERIADNLAGVLGELLGAAPVASE